MSAKREALKTAIKKAIGSSAKALGQRTPNPHLLDFIVDNMSVMIELIRDGGAGKLRNPVHLTTFLMGKSVAFGNLSESERAQCATAVGGLVTTLTGAVISSPAGPAAWVAFTGIALIDTLDIANKCHYLYENHVIERALAERRRVGNAVIMNKFPEFEAFYDLENLVCVQPGG